MFFLQFSNLSRPSPLWGNEITRRRPLSRDAGHSGMSLQYPFFCWIWWIQRSFLSTLDPSSFALPVILEHLLADFSVQLRIVFGHLLADCARTIFIPRKGILDRSTSGEPVISMMVYGEKLLWSPWCFNVQQVEKYLLLWLCYEYWADSVCSSPRGVISMFSHLLSAFV